MNKLIISCCICGAGTTKAQNPAVPITPEEIADDVVAVAKAGAAIAHLHVRDEDGKNTMETAKWIEVVELTRKKIAEAGVDICLNLTSSGGKFPEDMRQAHFPILLPEMMSYDPGTMNWGNSYVFLNTPQFLESLGKLSQELDIKPECEIFDGGMLGNVNYYVKKGILKAPVHYQFILGAVGGMPGNMDSLNYLLPKLPEGSTWSISGIGASHLPCMLLGLANGCDGLRVGLEDNIYMSKGVLATNVQLVERAIKIAKDCGREIATAEDARQILGLTKKM